MLTASKTFQPVKLFSLAWITMFCLLPYSEAVLAIEELKFTVIEQDKPFELRQYAPKIIAQVEVDGSMDDASSRGFRLIADYIFGNNSVPENSDQSEKISMTAPVTMAPDNQQSDIEKISMTAPVAMAQSGDKWQVHFVMPAEYTMETLPRPNNPAVSIQQLPVEYYAVIRFSGLTGAGKVDAKTNELLSWMAEKSLTPTSEPQLARYNRPWTLPMLRRNEVMIAYE